MDHNITFRRALLMGISPGAAARMRIRYLNEQIHTSLALSKHPINLLWCNEMMEEILFCTQKMQKPVYKNGNIDRITDADIEVARGVDVQEVIKFRNGKAFAFCHDDKRPSLTYLNKRKIAWCATCNRYFGAIDVLMERDSLNFVDTIKYLRR